VLALKIAGSGGDQTFTDDRPVVVGRGRGVDMPLTGAGVSRRHLVCTPLDGEWVVEDVSSLGTWAAGKRIQRIPVTGVTRLRLGGPTGPEIVLEPTLLRIPWMEPAPEPAPAVGASPSAASGTAAASGTVAVPAGSAVPAASAGYSPSVSPGLANPPEQSERSRQSGHPTPFVQSGPLGGADLDPAAITLLPGDRHLPTPAVREHGRRGVRPLRRGTLSVGRAEDSDIMLGDLLVSRRHAELLVGDSGVHIVDLGSANGTFVNGRRISRQVLADRDIIGIGHHLFQLSGMTLVEYVDAGNITFEADRLRVVVGENTLLNEVSFRLPGRSLLAVIGPSGAGKSTLLNALTGLRPADYGTVRYANRDMYDDYVELRRRIGHVPQDDLLHTTLTVRKALEYGARLRFPADTTAAERRDRVDEVLRELDLTERADTEIQKLSGGQRKRTSVALELLTKPTLLFLDEPTSGLDPGLDKNVMGTLRNLADGGRTVVVVTHSTAQLDVCDYVLVLARGGYTAYVGPPAHALRYFGQESWPDVFEMLAATPSEELARRFQESDFFVPGAGMAQPDRQAVEGAPSARQQSVLSQVVTLTRRQLSVMASDRSFLGLALVFPVILGILPRVVALPHKLNPLAGDIPNVGAQTLLTVVVLCGCFMGTSNSIREIVKEIAIYRRERAIGLSVTAYLGSKILVVFLITLAQTIVFTLISTAGRSPREALLLGSPMLDVMLTVLTLAFTSAMIGLAISAWVDTSDKVLPLLVLSTMSQVVFSGGLVPMAGKLGFEQVSYLMPSRWGYSAYASVVDLNAVGKYGPGPAAPGRADALWVHSAHVFGLDLAANVGIGIVAVAICVPLLRRRDPKTRRPAPVEKR